MKVGQHLLAGSVEASTARTYRSGFRKFALYLSMVSARMSIPTPDCRSAAELHALVSTRGIVEGFVSFCSLQGLSAEATDVYIDGLKFYAACLDGVPSIPGGLVISRLLQGLAKLGPRPNPRKLGIDSDMVRRLVVELSLMSLSPYERAMWKVLFCVAYFGCFRVSEFLISTDDLKLLSLDRVLLRKDGAFEFLLHKTKNNSRGPIQEVIFHQLGDDPICPVAAIHGFLNHRPVTPGSTPLFVNARGQSPITPKVFNAMVRLILVRLGRTDFKLFSAKSFRVGAASEAYSLGYSLDDVKGLGRWNSDAFMDYILSGARAKRARRIQVKLAGRRRKFVV